MLFHHLTMLVALAAAPLAVHAAPVSEPITSNMTSTLLDGSVVHDSIVLSSEDVTLLQHYAELQQRGLSKRAPSVYINFDDTLDTDIQRLSQLKQGWRDGIQLSSIVYNTWEEATQTGGTIESYFASADYDKVKQVFLNMWNFDDDNGSSLLGLVIWNKNDFGNQCIAPSDVQDGQQVTVAYVTNAQLSGIAVAYGHVCEQGYNYPAINDVSCASLGDTVSFRLNTLASVLIHEYTHFDRIGKNALGGTPIIDVANGYGPLNVRNLADADKLRNADNYRWFALEQFWHITCVKDFSGPRNADDTSEPDCNPGYCTIQ